MYKYYLSYAENFGLTKHIIFNTEFIAVHEADDSLGSGNWRLTLRKLPRRQERKFLMP